MILPNSADDPAINIVSSSGVYNDQLQRGVNTQTKGDIVGTSGRMLDGKIGRVPIQPPYFSLSPSERDEIAKQNSYVQGIVTGRMHRISGIDWLLEPQGRMEEDFMDAMRMRHQQWKEFKDVPELKYKIAAMQQKKYMMNELPDLLPGLENFNSALKRWRVKYKSSVRSSAQEVEDWINSANDQTDFEEFQKKWVYDLMIHGASSIFWDTEAPKIQQTFYMLPGGSVMQVRNPYAGPGVAWVQMVPGYETKIYYENEMIYDTYIPTSSRTYGVVPLDALVNKVAESLMFDRMSAERADGTKPPEKVVVFGETSPIPGFGGDGASSMSIPLPASDMARLEQKFNVERQNAIAVISGVGTPQILDLSRADTFAAQNERQKQVLKDMALVFNVSNLEINETDSAGTSGRSTAEALQRVDKEKGIGPIIRVIDKTMTKKILPRKFGETWVFKHQGALTELEQAELDTAKMQSGTFDVNEVREKRGDSAYSDEQFNKPSGAAAAMEQMGSLFNRG